MVHSIIPQVKEDINSLGSSDGDSEWKTINPNVIFMVPCIQKYI